MVEEESIEDLLTPSRLYAVRFHDEDEGRGGYYLLTRTRGVGLKGGIFIVKEKELKMLDKIGSKYEVYEPKTNCCDEIWEHFGIEPFREKPTLLQKILSYF